MAGRQVAPRAMDKGPEASRAAPARRGRGLARAGPRRPSCRFAVRRDPDAGRRAPKPL